jgi:hypothetical protein
MYKTVLTSVEILRMEMTFPLGVQENLFVIKAAYQKGLKELP